MIVAKCFGQAIAGGWWHEVSAYVVSFPFAFGSLCLIHKALNWHTPAVSSSAGGARPLRPGATDAAPTRTAPASAVKVPSYDY
jgi:hypothetical protein